MTIKTACFVLVSFVATACGGASGPEFPTVEFETVELNRSSGLGYCPSPGQILAARISQEPTGEFTFEFETAVQAPNGTDPNECLDPQEAECLLREEQTARLLTVAEVDALQTAIAEVPERQCDRDPNLACDPCLITAVTVDGHAASGACCGELNSDFRSGFSALTDVIDSLAP